VERVHALHALVDESLARLDPFPKDTGHE
jgi:hypothetical protein